SWSAHGGEIPNCGMSCGCDSGTVACCCLESPPATDLPSPGNTPPMTGQDLVPRMLWVDFAPFLAPKTSPEEWTTGFPVHPADARSKVRLPVLFCSILI
ncbi:MAG: hypothetical protein ABL994_15905, partial [Verrucomicrobiales bacterium]